MLAERGCWGIDPIRRGPITIGCDGIRLQTHILPFNHLPVVARLELRITDQIDPGVSRAGRYARDLERFHDRRCRA